jgi:hypothetical protein
MNRAWACSIVMSPFSTSPFSPSISAKMASLSA